MRSVKKDSTDQSVVIRIIDSTDGTPENAVEHDTAGIDLWYRREGSTKTSITEVALAALDSVHLDGGIELIGDGYYRLDPPDAAFATGANGVMIGGTVTGMIVIGTYISLVDYDPQDTVRLGLTALPNAAADAAGGLPISDAGGLDFDNLETLIERTLGMNQENFYIDNTVFASGNMTSCRIRIYSVAGSVGSASDVIATYNMTAGYSGDEMTTYKMVKA
jgi:hypothetical protein